MSQDFGDYRVVKARLPHKCIHCQQDIIPGEVHNQYVGKWQGEFQNWRVHADCVLALERCQGDDDELCLHGHRRGLSCGEIGAENPEPAPDAKTDGEWRKI